jgi:hypothetical protein
MNLLDRYLQAVKKHLPWQRQDDIIAELRANLESQLEEKEAALGRSLTAAEAEDWLKQLGAPIQMAAPYQPQQYLIGPTIFPIYWYVLKMAFFWCVVIYSIVTVVLIFTKDPSWSAVLPAVLNAPVVLMTVAAWVTLTFAAIEFAVTRQYIKIPAMAAPSAGWSPGALPPLEQETEFGKKPRSFANAAAEAIFGFFFLVWLLLIPRHPFLLMGPGVFYLNASPFELAPVWFQFFWCVVALNVLQVALHCVNLLRGTWQKPHPAQHVAIKVFGMIPLVLLLTASDHVTVILKHPALDEARYGGTLNTINHSVNWSLSVVCTIVVLQLGWEIGRIALNAYRKRAAAMQ